MGHNMLAVIASEKASLQEAALRRQAQLRADLAQCVSQLDTLLDMVLMKTLSQEEYVAKKQTLLNRKVELREALNRAEGRAPDGSNRSRSS